MKFFAVVILFAFTEAGVITNDVNCVIIRNLNYEKEILRNGDRSPYQLAIDHDTNTLFHSYTARAGEMFKIRYLSLKTGQYGIVSGIHGGFANAVNSIGHIIYMGGEDGIYQFDYDKNKATNLHVKDDANIWQMFYKDGLYFTTYPEEKAYLYKDGRVVEVPELNNIKVMVLAINRENDIIYSNSSGLFLYNRAEGHNTIHLADSVVNGFAVDIDGNLYYSTPNGLYYINEKTKGVEELAKIDDVYGLAIESNGNIIYATQESLVRLKPSKKICFDDKTFSKNVVELDP